MRPRHRRRVDTEMDPEVIWCKSVDWVHLAQDRVQLCTLVNNIMNPQVSYKTKFLDLVSDQVTYIMQLVI